MMCATLFGAALNASEKFDLLLKGGRIVDGTGAPWYIADVGIREGRIAAIGRLRDVEARQALDVTGLVVAPGFVDTDMTRTLTDAQREGLAAQIPLGRLGQAEDIAAAVCFLAGPGAAWITGETLNVNGGMHMA